MWESCMPNFTTLASMVWEEEEEEEEEEEAKDERTDGRQAFLNRSQYKISKLPPSLRSGGIMCQVLYLILYQLIH